ncbi:MAG TPA: MFS transporter [Acidimicrobiales bacterium]|nr:MFS transporter [Acidimicrobiales bacterium]
MTPGGSSGPGHPGSQRARPPFSLLVSITVTGIMGNVLLVPVLPDITADLGVASSRGGLLLAAATAPGIVLAPVIGVLADRFGRRVVVVPCLALFGIAGGLGGLAPSFGALLSLRLLQGVGSAGLINLAVVLITDHWEGPDRARMIGRNAAALTASLVALPPLGGLLAELGGWRATFVPYWIALLTAAASRARLAPGSRSTATLAGQLRATAPALRTGAVLGPMALGAGVFVLIFALLAAAPGYLDDDFGLGASARGLLLGLPALTSTAAALSLGRLNQRLGTRRLAVAGLSMLGAGLGLVGAAPSLVVVGAGLLAYGLGEGLLIATLQETVASSAPPDSRGAVVATWVGFARAGQTLGPILAGAGVAAVGARATFGVAASAAVALAALARRLPARRAPVPAA